jgi:hypothetical protein
MYASSQTGTSEFSMGTLGTILVRTKAVSAILGGEASAFDTPVRDASTLSKFLTRSGTKPPSWRSAG